MFRPARRSIAKARIALTGISGAGKTKSALLIAKGLAGPDGRIAVIDSEAGSSAKYSGPEHQFDLAVIGGKPPVDSPLAQYYAGPATIDNILKLMKEAEGQYSVVILDSITHPWRELCAEVDKVSNARFRGNSFQAWGAAGTPKQKAFVDAIINAPYHIIATMRAQAAYDIEERGGKKVPVRVGTKPEQGKDIEFEFDTLLELNAEHVATVIKDRTGGKFQDSIIDRPGVEFGEQVKQWLEDAPAADTPEPQALPPRTDQQDNVFMAIVQRLEECTGQRLSWPKVEAAVFGFRNCWPSNMQSVDRVVDAIKDLFMKKEN
jgi:hypothetical protein